MSESFPHSYRFDEFVVEPRTARLARGGEAVAVEPKAFEVLVFLLEHRDRLVDRQELLDEVWRGAFVTENALTRAVARLRNVLGDDAREPRFIATVHSRGYRFLAPVEVVDEALEDASGEPQSPSRKLGRWRLAAAAAAVITLVGVALATWRGGRESPRPPTSGLVSGESSAARVLDPHRIAVLPMVDLSDGGNGYFADGLTEQMISIISRIEGVRVVPRTSIMTYKGVDKRIAKIGGELGAGTVLEGSVRRDGDQLRITVQLIDAAREEYLWSKEFDRPVADIFAIQSEVAVRVAEALRSGIAPEELRRIRRGPTNEFTAYDHYLEGRQLYRQRTRIGNEGAIGQYRLALEIDPDFALAEAGLANAYAMRVIRYGFGDEWGEAAIAAAERALELDPELPEAYKDLGIVHVTEDRVRRGMEYSLRALELDPDYTEAAYNAASYSFELGLWDQALELQLRATGIALGRAGLVTYLWELGFETEAWTIARRAIREEPLSSYLNCYLALREWLAGDTAAARERMARMRQTYPLWPRVFKISALIELQGGDSAQALAHFEKALEVAGGDFPEVAVRSAHILWQDGRRQEAERTFDRIAGEMHRAIERGSDWWFHRWLLAAIAAIRGEPDEAVRWLEQAVDAGRRGYHWDEGDPAFASLRDDPRFQQQIRRMRASVAAMKERVVRELGAELAELRP